MRAVRVFLVPVVVALVWSVAGSSAYGFVTLKGYNGKDIYWDKAVIKWYLHPNGSSDVSFQELQSAVAAAFQSWKSVPCFTKQFSYEGTRTSDPQDGVYIRFVESNWDSSVDGAAAYAMTWKNNWGGGEKITNGVIVFNGQDVSWSTNPDLSPMSYQSDIEGVTAHELGHILGLDHSRELDATMFFTGGGTSMRTLEDDDRNGLCFIYGTFTQGKPCDSCNSDSHCASGICLQYPDGATYCGKDCWSNAQCPELFYCYALSSGTDQCVSNNTYCNQQGKNIALGSFCYGMETCQSGLCLVAYGDAYCSRTCTSDSVCGSLKCANGYCMKQGTKGFGEVCQSHHQCASQVCWLQSPDGVAYCSKSCSSQTDCPAGYACSGQYCITGGSGTYKADCEEDTECQSLLCFDPGNGDSFCSQKCSGDSQCPGTDKCALGTCSPIGSVPFGGPCQSGTDCLGALCKGFGATRYCTKTCAADTDCPGNATCLTAGYCSQASDIPKPCTDSAQCSEGQFCREMAGGNYGQCVVKCNAFADTGCSEGMDCRWVYVAASNQVLGECVTADPSAGTEGDECSQGLPCRPSLICAVLDQGTGHCYRDCKVGSGLGCSPGYDCVSANIAGDPLHGLCLCAGVCDPVITEPEPDVITSPDVVSSDRWTAPDQSGSGQDQKGPPGVDTSDPALADDPYTPLPGSPRQGSCSASPHHAGSSTIPGVLVVLLLAGLWVCSRRGRRHGRALPRHEP